MTISYQQVYDSIATMLDSGLDIKESLNTSAKGAKNELHDAIIAVKKSVEKGDTLARAFRKQSRVFPLMDRTLVEVGESSGRLPDVFKSLADWYRFKAKIIMIIKAGLRKPIGNLLAAAFIMPLPLLFSDSSGSYPLSVMKLLLIFFGPAFAIVILYMKSGEQGGFRLFVEKMVFKLPLAGNAMRTLALGRYCFGFWMLFESGIPVEKCAQIATDLSGNALVSEMVAGGSDSARQGAPVSSGFSSELPADFLSIWKVGEKSGRLSQTLTKLYKKQIELAENSFLELSQWLPRLVWSLVMIYFAYHIISFWSGYFTRFE